MVLTETSEGLSRGRRRGRPLKGPGAGVHRREWEQIADDDAKNLSEALHFARSTIRQEPNRHVTIQWRHAPSPTPIPERLRRVLNNTGTLIRRRTGKAAVWAYCREVGKLKGEHVHVLIYVPDSVWPKYRLMLRHWLETEAENTDATVKDSAICFQTITPGTIHNLKSYFLKEGSEEIRSLWVNNRQKNRPTGGKVHGKRLKVSHSIGPSARRSATDGPATAENGTHSGPRSPRAPGVVG